jgi:hypothetical protein
LTTVPTAIDYLVTTLTALSGHAGHVLEGAQIVDGEPGPNIETDEVAIGWAAEQTNADGQVTPAGLYSDAESYLIYNQVTVLEDDGPKQCRDRCFALFGAVIAAVKADPSLGGAVLNARLEFFDFQHVLTDDGRLASIVFAVRCEAFI